MYQKEDFVPMGYVRGATGIKGWIKIKADTEFADGLMDYESWFLGKDGKWQEYTPESGKVAPDGFQAKLVGIDDRNAAELLRGMTVAVLRSSFAETDEGEYYWVDLIGMVVKNPSGMQLGIVENLMESGAHDILMVRSEDGQMMLIPFVEKYIISVSQQDKILIADWQTDYLT